MLRSLYSGISGLRNHQVRMDTVGNNISNVNTTGFKSGRVNFQDSLSQYYSNNAAIGQNQVGTGMKVASINNNYTQGAMQATGRTLDMAIQGDGFFVVRGGGGNELYTREGLFFIDMNGYIVNSNGLRLQGGAAAGTPGNQDIQVVLAAGQKIATLSISSTGVITGTDTSGANLNITNPQISLANFANRDALKKEGGSTYSANPNTSGPAEYIVPSAASNNTVNSGYLEMSNVDLSQEMVDMMTTQRGFQANARTITVSDSLLEELVNLKR